MSILGKAVTSGQLPPLRAWLYGPPDAGKTHFAVQFPNPILLSTDGNYVYETIPANSISKWEVGPLAKDDEKAGSLINVIGEIVKNPKAYGTVILDLVDGAFDLVREHYIKLLKITHESDLGFGKAYDAINRNFLGAIAQLFKLPINIIIISHESTEIIKPRNAAEYTVFKPSLNDKYHQKIEGYCSLVTRIYLDTDANGTQVRKLSLSPKENEYGINRLGQAEDLVLTFGGDNYSDFLAVWERLWEERGMVGNTVVDKNATRERIAKEKAEAEKAAIIEKAQRAAEMAKDLAKKSKAPVVEEVEEVNVEPIEATDTEVVEETVVEDTTQEGNKIAALKAVEARRAAEALNKQTTAKAPKPKATKAVEVDDGEPVIEISEASQAKLARIKQLQAQKAASQK